MKQILKNSIIGYLIIASVDNYRIAMNEPMSAPYIIVIAVLMLIATYAFSDGNSN